MASGHEFFSNASPEQVRSVVAQALTERGFTVESTPAGGFVAKRGSVLMTVLFGGLSGRQLAMSFTVQIMHLDGQIVTRLGRVAAGAVATGGALGATKTDAVFKETANAIGAALAAAGILASSRQVS